MSENTSKRDSSYNSEGSENLFADLESPIAHDRAVFHISEDSESESSGTIIDLGEDSTDTDDSDIEEDCDIVLPNALCQQLKRDRVSYE